VDTQKCISINYESSHCEVFSIPCYSLWGQNILSTQTLHIHPSGSETTFENKTVGKAMYIFTYLDRQGGRQSMFCWTELLLASCWFLAWLTSWHDVSWIWPGLHGFIGVHSASNWDYGRRGSASITTRHPLFSKVGINFADKRRSVLFARGLRPRSFCLFVARFHIPRENSSLVKTTVFSFSNVHFLLP
jgi:hypothetical protein